MQTASSQVRCAPEESAKAKASMALKISDSSAAGNQHATIEAIARETDMPVAIVKEIYVTQHRQLEKEARVKTYLPVLTSSRVKHILNERKLNERKQTGQPDLHVTAA
jgi:hypothetical protein